MKKSEILEHLSDIHENVDSYYRINDTDLIVVYIKELNWKHLEKMHNVIIDICASEKGNDYIRTTFQLSEWD